MADPRKFIMNSDYPMPAFVAKWEDDILMASGSYIDTSFNHNLPFTPLIVGVWSIDPGARPSYDISLTNGLYVGKKISQSIGSNSTKIKISVNNNTGSLIYFHYRIFAFAPSDYDGDIPALEDSTSFRLNSDFNYPKLFAYGKANLTTGQDFVYHHNLGYTPQCRTWFYDSTNDILSPTVNAHYEDGSWNRGTIIDTTKMTYKGGKNGDKLYYHIYADEF